MNNLPQLAAENVPSVGQLIGLDPAIVQNIVAQHRDQVRLTREMLDSVNREAMRRVQAELYKAQISESKKRLANAPTPEEARAAREADVAKARAQEKSALTQANLAARHIANAPSAEEAKAMRKAEIAKTKAQEKVTLSRARLTDIQAEEGPKKIRVVNPETGETKRVTPSNIPEGFYSADQLVAYEKDGDIFYLPKGVKPPGGSKKASSTQRVEQIPPEQRAQETNIGKTKADLLSGELLGRVEADIKKMNPLVQLDQNTYNNLVLARMTAVIESAYPDMKISYSPSTGLFFGTKDGKTIRLAVGPIINKDK